MPAGTLARARIHVEEDGVVCGLDVARAVFGALDGALRFEAARPDGAQVAAGDVVAELEGAARAVLTGERTALNLLGRLSGIATLTRRYVDAVAGTARRSSTRARRRPACARSRSTPSAAAAGRTTAPGSTTRSS